MVGMVTSGTMAGVLTNGMVTLGYVWHFHKLKLFGCLEVNASSPKPFEWVILYQGTRADIPVEF